MDTQMQLPIRNAGLFSALRKFIVSAFELLAEDRSEGADISFSVAEHSKLRDDKPFYEYRPMTERFVEQRFERIWALEAADDAAWTVSSDPACTAFLRAGRVDTVADMELVARQELLAPMLISMSEASPTFELDEKLFLEQYLRFERTLYAKARRYVAIVPIWGIKLLYGDLEIAQGVTIRSVDAEWFRMEWPEASQLDWGLQAHDGLPTAVLQLERQVEADEDETAIDPLSAIVDVVSSIRILAGGSVTAGPILLERFDWRALAPRPVPAMTARPCGQFPSRIDGTVANFLPVAVRRISSEPNGMLARAMERYQLAATAQGMSALRSIYDMLVEIYSGERESASSALRLSVVLGGSLPERRAYLDAMNLASSVVRGGTAGGVEVVQATRLLGGALRATVAAALVGELPITSLCTYADTIIIGERERKQLGIAAMVPELNQC